MIFTVDINLLANILLSYLSLDFSTKLILEAVIERLSANIRDTMEFNAVPLLFNSNHLMNSTDFLLSTY